MPIEIVTLPGAVFCLWGTPRLEDVERVGQVLRAGAEQAGHPIVYVTRVPASAPPPDAAVRTELNRLIPEIVACCSSYHVLLEGTGFTAAIKRGVLLSLFQLTSGRRKFFVHAGVDGVLGVVDPAERPAAGALIVRVRSEGLLARDVRTSEAPV